MDTSRILLIGRDGPFRRSTFTKPPNLAEFNAVVWYPASLLVELMTSHGEVVLQKLSELIEWIKRGNSLIVVGAPPDEFKVSYLKNRSQHSVDLLKGELFRNVSYKRTTGHLIEFCGSDNLAGYLSALTQLIAYDAVLTGAGLLPLFQVSISSKSETQLVGAYCKLGAGIVVYAPLLRADFKDLQVAQSYSYFVNLACILEGLQSEPHSDLPDWVNGFQTEEENKINKEIFKAVGKIRRQERNIETYETSLAQERAPKALFTSTGDLLAQAVAEGLRQLGLSVVDGPKQRADLIVRDGKRLAALEVKGLEGGAKEKNVGQVKRWTADLSVALSTPVNEVTDLEIKAYQQKLTELSFELDDMEEEIDCKGILILNTYRKLSLQERPESYPDPVSKIVVRSEICALTGLQLFLMLQEARRDQSKRRIFIDKLFSTSGVLDECRDWTTALHQV